jgi:tRNA modification GTPase
VTGQGDTIFALASARGKAGVAVFRISGRDAHDVARALAGELPPPRRAGLRRLIHDGRPIDEAVVLAFAEGASFTGEPVVELHVHGSPAVIRTLTAALGSIPGCRGAEPGEFTRRAMVNGRLDLTQVEGLGDLIEAETEAQLRQAQRALAGDLGRRVEEWRETLIRTSALVEAEIDFSDEEDAAEASSEVGAILDGLLAAWRREIGASDTAERIRSGFEVAIVGAPNSGKSTLINRIARADIAITSVVPGTTRDVIEARVDLAGLPVTFLDTAGLRTTEDEIEAIGVRRATDRAAAADLRLFLDESPVLHGIALRPGDIRLHGKSDLGRGDGLNVSGKTGEGIDDLLRAVAEELESRVADGGVATRARHRAALETACDLINAARRRLETGPLELVADDLRSARHTLDVLVGRVDVEDILGHIFSSFCIGK